MRLGYCTDCSAMFESPVVRDGLCPLCQRDEDAIYKNDPTPDVETDSRQWTKAAMRERLGVTGDVDE